MCALYQAKRLSYLQMTAEEGDDEASNLSVSLLATRHGLVQRGVNEHLKSATGDGNWTNGPGALQDSSATTCEEVAQLPGLDCCADATDCSPYSWAELNTTATTWDWLSAQCKSQNADVCLLWKPCNAEGNLTKGATQYWAKIEEGSEVGYCKREHCGNTLFDLETTTLADAEAYCDTKFGSEWRDVKAGPMGFGPPGPGSGLWECAHGNYHCDWAYCKINVCDKVNITE